jgi:hypothetical protein
METGDDFLLFMEHIIMRVIIAKYAVGIATGYGLDD